MQQAARKGRKRKHFIPEWASAQGKAPGDLIKATGADKSVVSRWLGSKRSEPAPDYLESLGRLFGVAPDRLYAPPVREVFYSSDDPAAPEPINPDPQEEPEPDTRMTIGSATGARGIPVDASPQIDVTAGLGAGGVTILAEGVRASHGLTFAAEFIDDYWRLPDGVHSSLRSGRHPHDIAIIPVQGNSMAPMLVEGDFVFIDTRHRVPSPDGIYALLDEYDGVIVKTLRTADREVDEEGPWVEIVSKNADYPTKVRRAAELRIVGRVVRRFTADFGND